MKIKKKSRKTRNDKKLKSGFGLFKELSKFTKKDELHLRD
jgi:hypothetical protein